MVITLPFDTPTANVLRFILVEYLILKLFSIFTESLAHISAYRRATNGENVTFREGLPAFFLLPYRIIEHSLPRRILLWSLVIISNAFLLSIEFGFQSTNIEHTPVIVTNQQLPADLLGPSRTLEDVPDINWIARTRVLADKCLNRKGGEVFAAEGFLKDVFLNDSKENITKADTICFGDSRVHTELNRVMFNISYLGMQDTQQPFRFMTVQVTVRKVSDNLYNFAGGDTDLDVTGKLDLSLNSRDDGDYEFDVFGSCTGFKGSGSDDALDPDVDRNIYCYLSDRDQNRFIVQSRIDDPNISGFQDVVQGDSLRLVDSGMVFRATILLFENTWKARDGDHLAALKSLVTTFRPRPSSASDKTVISQFYPSIARTFYIATMIGATSVRTRLMPVETDAQQKTERAQVTLWAFVLLCVVIGILTPLAVLGMVLLPKYCRLNVPVTYNCLAELFMETRFGSYEEKRKEVLVCGFFDDGQDQRYGPLESSSAACEASDCD